MDRLQVRREQVRIPPRHLQRGMTEDLLQMEDRAAAPDVIDPERMPEGVQRSHWRVKPEPLA